MPYTWVFHLDDGPVEVENYWLPATAYEEAMRSAGFMEVRWHRPRLSPIGMVGQTPDYWTVISLITLPSSGSSAS